MKCHKIDEVAHKNVLQSSSKSMSCVVLDHLYVPIVTTIILLPWIIVMDIGLCRWLKIASIMPLS